MRKVGATSFWVSPLIFLASFIVSPTVFAILIAAFAGNSTNRTNSNSNNKVSYYINDTVQSGKVLYSVRNVEDTNKIGLDATNYNYLVVTLVIKNIGTSEISLTSSNFKLLRSGATYEPNIASIYLENGFYALKNIGAGLPCIFRVVFEVPTKSTTGDYVLELKGGSLLDTSVKVNLTTKY